MEKKMINVYRYNIPNGDLETEKKTIQIIHDAKIQQLLIPNMPQVYKINGGWYKTENNGRKQVKDSLIIEVSMQMMNFPQILPAEEISTRIIGFVHRYGECEKCGSLEMRWFKEEWIIYES